MTGTLSPRMGVVLLLAIAIVFGSNHIAARVAFDHGTSVITAITVRSGGTALFLVALMRAQSVPMALSRLTTRRAVTVGVFLAAQSFCLYSAVARIHPALALLTFQTFPLLLSLLSWACGGERPSRRAVLAMPLALAGLALALDVAGKASGAAVRWAEIGAGVGFALGGALAFAGVLFLTTKWLTHVDGRLRSLVTMGTTAVLATAVGVATSTFALPASTAGWAGLALLTLFYGVAITALFVFLPRLGAVNNALVLSFEPVAVLFLAWAILGQAIVPLQVVGAFVVVGAIIYLTSGVEK